LRMIKRFAGIPEIVKNTITPLLIYDLFFAWRDCL